MSDFLYLRLCHCETLPVFPFLVVLQQLKGPVRVELSDFAANNQSLTHAHY